MHLSFCFLPKSVKYMVICFGFGNHQIRLDQNTLNCLFYNLHSPYPPGWLLTFTSVFSSPLHSLFKDLKRKFSMMASPRLSMSCKNKFCYSSGMGRHLWPLGVSGITFITLWPIFIIYGTLLDINVC